MPSYLLFCCIYFNAWCITCCPKRECVICTLPHFGILLFFYSSTSSFFLFWFFVALISRVAFFLLCSRTRYVALDLPRLAPRNNIPTTYQVCIIWATYVYDSTVVAVDCCHSPWATTCHRPGGGERVEAQPRPTLPRLIASKHRSHVGYV